MMDEQSVSEVKQNRSQDTYSNRGLKRFTTASVDVARKLFVEPKARKMRTEVFEHLRHLKASYGIDVDMGRQSEDDFFVAEMFKMNLAEASVALKFIRQEIEKYPPEYLQYCNLKKLRLVKNLKKYMDELDQENTESKQVGGFAQWEEGTIYIDTGNSIMNYLMALHHELLHMGDTTEASEYMKKNSEITHSQALEMTVKGWAELNPNGKGVYGPTEENGQRLLGFARQYGKNNEYEDRATIAEFVMIGYPLSRESMSKNTVLKAKSAYMMDVMRKRSGGKMSQKYFEDLFHGKAKLGYWRQTPTDISSS